MKEDTLMISYDAEDDCTPASVLMVAKPDLTGKGTTQILKMFLNEEADMLYDFLTKVGTNITLFKDDGKLSPMRFNTRN